MITRYATLKSAGFGLMAAILLATTASSDEPAQNLGPTLLPATSPVKSPDAEAFLQRWLILEPIRANGLTDSSVQATVKADYFPNQFSVLPEEGDQVTVGGTNLTWHAVDTKNYNVNLFHFARALNRPTSNVLFWMVTVVHCPEEMTGVRLAIGSNAASVWWVNGQEVIGIYGDRQTVIDDGVSKRLTLRKGPNVVLGAVVNSGGATDFCARFLDKNDKPLLLPSSVLLAADHGFVPPPEPVASESGMVQGSVEKDLTVYRGIPFAAPPIGDLRWRPPQPTANWEGVRETTQFAPDPYQGNGAGNVSEDCLYLNVWTPADSADAALPVLVWIYGGGFSFGSTSTPTHNGEHLARKGVVLVSINYRVGPLGFLAHPELSAESPHNVSGNYGLQDQIAGLKWVKRNIAAFGGDPNKVTIVGESAGGISVSILCASPEAKGLFRGAISQSGGSFGPPRPTTYPGENMRALAQAERAGVAFAERAGASSIAELRKTSPDKFPPSFGSGAAWPIIDGWVIPDDQYKLYEVGNYNDVDVLVGYNSDEGLSLSRERTTADFITNVEQRYGPFADRLLKAYPVGSESVPKTARDLMRDAAFGWHTWIWARLQARTGQSKVFYYYFDQHPDRPEDSPEADHGTPHGVDVPYVFETLDRSDPKVTPADLDISEALATYWTNFAKRGDPNGDGVPTWPRFTEGDRQVMHFNQKPYPGPVPSATSLEVLDAYFAWRRTPAGAAWAE